MSLSFVVSPFDAVRGGNSTVKGLVPIQYDPSISSIISGRWKSGPLGRSVSEITTEANVHNVRISAVL